MALLQEEDRSALRKEFSNLAHPVRLVVFTQEMDCQYCRETVALVEEISSLSDSISTESIDIVKDAAIAKEYNIEKVPAIALLKEGEEPKDYGIRYFGIPSGYEFSSLITDIMIISSGDSGLSAETRNWVAGLESPIHLQVFVTPTCPYCPQAVILAHRLAMESDMIRADMVEAMEFPELSNRYHVQGVPRTVINEDVHMEGAAPEPMLLTKLQEAVQVPVF